MKSASPRDHLVGCTVEEPEYSLVCRPALGTKDMVHYPKMEEHFFRISLMAAFKVCGGRTLEGDWLPAKGNSDVSGGNQREEGRHTENSANDTTSTED